MDAISEARLALLCPALADIIRSVADTMAQDGVDLRVVQGLRSLAEQNALYAEGRTIQGRIVTDARGGMSMHNYGLAVDMVPGIRGQNPWAPNWNENHPDFQQMIHLCEAHGLVAGARWIHIPDYDHFQMPGVPVSPDPAMLACLTSGGCEAVWTRYFPSKPAPATPLTA